jgi:hypothetical protein
MKARKKVRSLEACLPVGRVLMVGGLLLFLSQTAEGQPFSEGKNLFQLRESLRKPMTSEPADVSLLPLRFIGRTTPSRPTNLSSPVFLPRWSAEELPFFCRIEHDFAKKSALPVKFRLGSVEYVDWLEGKGDWESWRH